MRLRDQVALTLPSLLLRLALGITFLWAGTGKFMGTYLVSGDDAARLANAGITLTAPALPTEPEPTQSQSTEDAENTDPEPVDNETALQANEIVDQMKTMLEESPDEPVEEPAQEPDPIEEAPIPEAQDQYQFRSVQYDGASYAAADFPEPMEAKQLYSISLMILKASDPGLTADSTPIKPIMPAMFASPMWAKGLAWAVAITELAAGACLLLGFLTRLSALSVSMVMLVAIWMTNLGPAIIQSDDAVFGFLLRVDNLWANATYQGLLWQLGLAAMGGAVFFLGSGAIGIDRLLFRPRFRDPYIHGDPKPAKPKKSPKEEPAPNRGEFDRTPNHTP